MNSELNKNNVPIFNAIAITGEGVKETLMEIAKLVFNHLRKTLLLESEIGTLKEEEIGEIVGREIDERFVSEPEEIEDIDDVEELPAEADLSINFGELSAGDGMQEESVDVDAKSIDVDPGANISEAVETPEDYEIEEEHDPDWGEGDIAGLLDEIEIEEEIEVAEEPMKETKDVALSVESEGLKSVYLSRGRCCYSSRVLQQRRE
jgi:hypothetical protein